MNYMNERQKWLDLANRYLNAETSTEEELELFNYYTTKKRNNQVRAIDTAGKKR